MNRSGLNKVARLGLRDLFRLGSEDCSDVKASTALANLLFARSLGPSAPVAPPSVGLDHSARGPLMLVMGISCHYHDSAVALIDENEIAFAIHEERLSRVKHDRRFPALAAARGLQACGIPINDVAEVVFYENPELKLKRLWDQVIDYWPRSRDMFEREKPRFVPHTLRSMHSSEITSALRAAVNTL